MPTIGCVGLGVQRNGIKSHNKMQTFKIPHFKVKKKKGLMSPMSWIIMKIVSVCACVRMYAPVHAQESPQ